MRLSQFILVCGLGLAACGPKAPPQSAAEPVATEDGAAGEGTEAAAPVWDERRRDETYNSALSLLATGKSDDAKRALEMLGEVGQQEPDLAEVPYNQGVAWLTIGDTQQARKRFLRATEIDPNLAPAWQNLGALAEERGELDRALQHYRSGLRYAPEDGPLRAAEIGVLRQMRQYDAAMRQAKAAIQADSNNVDAYNQLGLVYLETNQVELAQFIYNRALQIVSQAKNDPHMHANLGRVYWEQDLKSLASQEFEKALALDPNLVLARLYVAEMAMDNRDYATIVATLEPTLAFAADDPAVHLNLGIGYRGTGRLEDAKKSYEKALELNPSDPSPYLNLAVLMGDHFKDYDKALGLLDTYQRQGGKQLDLVATWRTDFQKQQKRLEIAAKRRKRREEADQRRKDAAAAEARLQKERERKAQEEAAATPTPAPTEAPPPAEAPPPEPPPADPPPAAAPSAASAGQSCSAIGACGEGHECAHDAVCRPSATPGTYSAGIGCFQDADCAYGLSCTANKCAEAGASSGGASPWGN